MQLLEKIKKNPFAYQQAVEDFILEKKVNSSNTTQNRTLGLLNGKMKMSSDFDARLDDLKDYM